MDSASPTAIRVPGAPPELLASIWTLARSALGHGALAQRTPRGELGCRTVKGLGEAWLSVVLLRGWRGKPPSSCWIGLLHHLQELGAIDQVNVATAREIQCGRGV